MDAEFWIKSWTDGRTAFNQQQYHAKLTQYFPQLNPQAGQSVLVPLCGKTIDMVWLASQGLQVHGVELYEGAVEAFFAENQLPVQKTQTADFVECSHKNIKISCGDFFKLDARETFDFVYDRAALVALPASMRADYARVIKQALKKGGKYFLVVYEYDQSKMEAPPFSISIAEIERLYADAFDIQLIESEKPKSEGPRLSAVEGMKQNVYILQKKILG
ncbi:MAG TPA: thiopurine S-methyltransferase [Candidatus Omnitrophota bacterium]|nr:thiopurine S-methyltransferase [Candidatus Omnitrophota bacterium]